MRYFKLKALIAFYISIALTGSTWAASRDQILDAIGRIWTNLPSCYVSGGERLERIGAGHHFFFDTGVPLRHELPRGLKSENFVIFSTVTKEGDEMTRWAVMFNPADLKNVGYEQNEYPATGFFPAITSRRILFKCEPSKECVFFSGWGRWQYSASLATCASETEVNRINNALQDLRLHYKQTPKPLY